MPDQTAHPPRTTAAEITHKYGHRLAEIEPLLETPDFRLVDTDVDDKATQQFLLKLRDLGAFRVARREVENGTRRIRYRWVDGVRERFRDYLARVDRLPCGHRWHVARPPGTPSGWLRCKWCDRYCSVGEATDRRGES